MKKYIILLIIPLLFFSIGCNDDDDEIDNTIPVSEYPESILGSWKNEIFTTTTTTQSIEIDPIYGTETSETFSQTDNSSPLAYYYGYPTYVYYTFKYDETLDFYVATESPNEDIPRTQLYNGEGDYSINQNQIIIIQSDIVGTPLPGPYGDIQDFTNSSFTVNRTTIDTTEIVNNSYSIIETSENYFFERIEDIDIPTSN